MLARGSKVRDKPELVVALGLTDVQKDILAGPTRCLAQQASSAGHRHSHRLSFQTCRFDEL